MSTSHNCMRLCVLLKSYLQECSLVLLIMYVLHGLLSFVNVYNYYNTLEFVQQRTKLVESVTTVIIDMHTYIMLTSLQVCI